MANYSTNDFKGGLKLMIDGDPCSIIENEIVKPGKGQAFNRVKLRNLKSGGYLNERINRASPLKVRMSLRWIYSFSTVMTMPGISWTNRAMSNTRRSGRPG